MPEKRCEKQLVSLWSFAKLILENDVPKREFRCQIGCKVLICYSLLSVLERAQMEFLCSLPCDQIYILDGFQQRLQLELRQRPMKRIVTTGGRVYTLSSRLKLPVLFAFLRRCYLSLQQFFPLVSQGIATILSTFLK